MKLFGTKLPEPTDEDRVAAERLSALAARLKPETSSDLTEVSPDPLGEPEAPEEPEAAREPEGAQESEGLGDSRESDSEE
jgi:hypothetical protein